MAVAINIMRMRVNYPSYFLQEHRWHLKIVGLCTRMTEIPFKILQTVMKMAQLIIAFVTLMANDYLMGECGCQHDTHEKIVNERCIP